MLLVDDTQSADLEMVWQGPMEYTDPAEADNLGGTVLPTVQVFQPTWWNDQQIMGEKWVHPENNNRYGVVRFPFSIAPLARQKIQILDVEIQLMAAGTGKAPVAFDMFPGSENVMKDVERTIGFKPTFKFDGVEVGGPELAQTIKSKTAAAIITAYNVMTDHPKWIFTAHNSHPLQGNQNVYLVLEIPSATQSVRATIQIKAELNDKVFGLAIGWLPHKSIEERTFKLW